MGYTDRREVKQFQFTAWPDHGVPEHPAPFLQFIRRIHMLNPGDSGPIVTHCRSELAARYFAHFFKFQIGTWVRENADLVPTFQKKVKMSHQTF